MEQGDVTDGSNEFREAMAMVDQSSESSAGMNSFRMIEKESRDVFHRVRGDKGSTTFRQDSDQMTTVSTPCSGLSRKWRKKSPSLCQPETEAEGGSQGRSDPC